MSVFERSWFQFLKMKKINQQIFLLTIITVTIPLIIIAGIAYHTSLQSVKNEHIQSSDLILKNLSFNIDQYFKSIETGTLAIYMENDFQKTFENWQKSAHKYEPYQYLQTEESLEQFIRSINMSVNHVDSVQVYTDDKIFVSDLFQHQVYDLDNMNRSAKYRQVLEKKGQLVLFGSHPSLYNAGSEKQVITIARAVNKKGTQSPLGVIFIDIHLDELKNILSLSEGSERQYILLDDKDKLVYASDQGILTRDANLATENLSLIEKLKDDEGYFYDTINQEKVFVNYEASPYSGWRVIQYVDESKMTEQANLLRKILLFLILSSLITAALFLVFLNRQITRPIVDLSKQVERFGQGELVVDLDVNRQDEFGYLYREVHQMAQDLRAFIERSSDLKAKQKVAHYSALKSQIHPHFLANALETIQMKAVIQDQFEVAEMIGTLGQLFRMSIQSGKEMVTLAEELTHVRLYIKVQQMRFLDRMSYKEKIPDALMSQTVLHFSIQPFVENAITHGLELLEGQGTICLSAEAVQNDLFIKIQDNGLGMDATELESIRTTLSSNENILVGDHIGLKNVHDQMRHYFGERYGIHITSQKGKGTTVIMHFPLQARDD